MMGIVHNHEHGLLAEAQDEMRAKDAALILDREYPGHPWRVGYQGHMITIHHAEVEDYVVQMGRFAKGFCYAINWDSDAKRFAEQVKEGGGKTLEAFNIPRGKWIGIQPSGGINGLFTQKVGVLQNGS